MNITTTGICDQSAPETYALPGNVNTYQEKKIIQVQKDTKIEGIIQNIRKELEDIYVITTNIWYYKFNMWREKLDSFLTSDQSDKVQAILEAIETSNAELRESQCEMAVSGGI